MSSSRVAVVTGSNKGIGLSIVRSLCQQFDGIVYLTSRNEKLGKEAVELLQKEGLNPKYHQLDIDSIDSINRLQKYLQSTHGGIDVLVNNAGIAYNNAATEPFAEQAEVTNRVNYFGTKNASIALIPLLRPHARVVNISSLLGHLTVIKGQEPQASELRNKFSSPNLSYEDLDSLVNTFVKQTKSGTHKENGWPQTAYGVSKVAVSALTIIQQREMDKARPNDDIVFNHVHPGYVDTDMSSHTGPLTPDQGAVAATWLALLPPGTNLKGAYVWHDKTVVDWVDGKFPSQY